MPAPETTVHAPPPAGTPQPPAESVPAPPQETHPAPPAGESPAPTGPTPTGPAPTQPVVTSAPQGTPVSSGFPIASTSSILEANNAVRRDTGLGAVFVAGIVAAMF